MFARALGDIGVSKVSENLLNLETERFYTGIKLCFRIGNRRTGVKREVLKRPLSLSESTVSLSLNR